MDWGLIAVVVVAVLSIVFSGAFWLRFKNLVKQTSELMVIVSAAIEDNSIDNAEITEILKEAKDVGEAAIDIFLLFKKFRK